MERPTKRRGPARVRRAATSRIVSGASTAALTVALVGWGAGAAAAGERSKPSRDGWTAQITAYGWMAGLGGTVRPARGGPTFEVSDSFGDILDKLDAAVFATAFARHERTILFASIDHVATSETVGVPPIAPPIDAISGDVALTSGALAGGYRVLSADRYALDAMVGARVWWVDAEAMARAGGTPVAARSEILRFADPILGARGRVELGGRLNAIAQADFGGFGAGSAFTWQAFGTVNYRVTDSFYLSAGYRHLSVDYRDGGRIFDVDLSGPLIGATLRF